MRLMPYLSLRSSPQVERTDKLTITIKNLRLNARVGVTDTERNADREIILNIWIDYNAERAVKTDLLRYAIDYRDIRDRVAALISAKPFKLIETIAAETAAMLASNQNITKIRVEVDKPGALRLAESVSATHSWSRDPAGEPEREDAAS
jgi:FolB domain-containing protein